MKKEKAIKQLDWIREKFGNIENYIRIHYGEEAPFSIIGDCCLVHLDNPDEKTIQERKEEFLKDDGLDDDCLLCQMQREEGGFVVYDGCNGFCPECKQKETCESYEPKLWNDDNIENLKAEEMYEANRLPNRMWSRSSVNTDNIDEMPSDLARQILLFGVLAHATELKMDCENRKYSEDVIQGFLDPLETACGDLKFFINKEAPLFIPEGIRVNIQIAISALSQLVNSEIGEKAKDLTSKLEKLLTLVEQI